MAFKDFASTQYCKTIDTGELVRLGSFQETTNGFLAHIRAMLVIRGVTNLAGTEKIRLKIFSDVGFSSLLYTSEWSNLSDITGLGSADWIGWIRCDFNKHPINKNLVYYVAAELTGYTRNADIFWCGLNYDFPFPVYDNSENLFYDHPLAMQIFSYKAV